MDNLTGLDGDPAVMRFITGGRTTPPEEIEKDLVPAFLSYYERYDGYAAFGQPSRRRVGISWAGSTSGRHQAARPMSLSWGTDCAK